jgi:hypothetical protein
MLVNQTVHCGQWVVVQTAKKLVRSFGFSQATSAGLILGQRNLTELLQQLLLRVGQKEDLILSKVPQFASGFTPADTALMAAQPSKQRLQLQVVWR